MVSRLRGDRDEKMYSDWGSNGQPTEGYDGEPLTVDRTLILSNQNG